MAINARQKDAGGTLYPFFTGFVREPSLNPDPNTHEAVYDCVDLVERLRRVKISTPLYTGQRSDQLIAAILTLAGYTGATNLETGAKTFLYASWRKAYALDAIQQVVDSEMGNFFIGADGRPTFHNRYHRTLNTTPKVTLSGTMAGLTWRQTADDIYNEALITCYPRVVGSAGSELWRWQEAPTALAPGESRTIEATYTDSTTQQACEATAVIAPVVTTDYTGNTKANGTGTNKSASLSVTMTAYGQYASLTITNTDASSVYVTLLKLRGTPISKPNPLTMRAINAASQATYGIVSTIQLDQPLESDSLAALDSANYLVAQYGTPPDRISLQVKPADAARKTALATLDLNDLVAITDSETGLTAQKFFIDQINESMPDDPLRRAATYQAMLAPASQTLIVLDSGAQTFADLMGF